LFLAKGFNLLIERQLIPDHAMGVYTVGRLNDADAIINKGWRLLFIIPWHGHSLIGTEHFPYDGDPENLDVSEEEIQAILDGINWGYPDAELKRQDICLIFKGQIPVTSKWDKERDVNLLKKYKIIDHKVDGIEGLVSVTGAKFTEARMVAEKTVDLVFKKMTKMPTRSITAHTPIYGGQIENFDLYLKNEINRKAYSLDAETIQYLIYNYGSAYAEVLKYLGNDLDKNIYLDEKCRVIRAQVIYAIRKEMARKLTDVVFRRLPIAMACRLRDSYLKICVETMAKELKWDHGRIGEELKDVNAKLSSLTNYG